MINNKKPDNITDKEWSILEPVASEEIEKVTKLVAGKNSAFQNLSSGKMVYYHHLIWKAQGYITTETIFEGYNLLLRDYPILRTNYMESMLDVPVEIVYQNTEKVFPIVDISMMDGITKSYKIINVAAAEARRTYDAKKDSPLRLQAFIIGDRTYAIIISFIPELCAEISKTTLANYIFPNMEFEQNGFGALSKTVKSLNGSIQRKNYEYWENQLHNIDKILMVPGESKLSSMSSSRIMSSAYKSVDAFAYEAMRSFCETYHISIKSLFSYAWLMILGKLHKEDHPFIAIVGNYGQPKLFPIGADIRGSAKKALVSLEESFSLAAEYGYIEPEDEVKLFGKDFIEHFHIQLQFTSLDGQSGNDYLSINNDYTANDIGLTVRYVMSKDGCRINYVYKSDVYQYKSIEALHEFYMKYISKLIARNELPVDSSDVTGIGKAEDYIANMVNQCFDILKTSSVFNVCTPDAIMRIAKKCQMYHLAMDDEILRAGDSVDSFYIVGAGSIEQSVTDTQGLAKTILILSAGEMIGAEMLMFTQAVNSTYTVASDEAVIIKIAGMDMEAILEQEPYLWKMLLQNMHNRLTKMERMWLLE